MNVLVLGGYGNFGARIVRALAGDPGMALLVGGRDAGRARALAAEVGGGAVGLALDAAAADFPARLLEHAVELVIHTAGPFQGQDYAVARAAAHAQAHYIDLADGRRFVCDFPAALDAVFRSAGRVAVTGASTVPALSSAVVEHLCAGWERIDTLDLCIAPAQTAPRGRATLEAVLGYCGAPVRVWDDGRWQAHTGWACPLPVTFARLRPRLGALCDIPDLELFPAHYRVARRVMFRAALEVGPAQRGLALVARLRAAGWLRDPARWAGALNAAAAWLDPLGSATGGMVVRASGVDAAGRVRQRAWHITAGQDHGPEIPCMAAILLARRLARGGDSGARPAAGATTALGLLRLAEFQPEFDRWGMLTDTVDEDDPHGARPA